MKDDRRHGGRRPVARGALPHGDEGRPGIVGGPDRQSRMHPHRGEEVGIGRAEDVRGGAAGGQPGDIDARRIDGAVAHDLAHDPGDQRRLARAAELVAPVEPVPAPLGVGVGGLGRDRPRAGRIPPPARSCASLPRNRPESARNHAASRPAASARRAARRVGFSPWRGHRACSCAGPDRWRRWPARTRRRAERLPCGAPPPAARASRRRRSRRRSRPDPSWASLRALALRVFGLAAGRFRALGFLPASAERLQRIGSNAQVGGCGPARRLGDRASEPEHLHPRSVVNRTGGPKAGSPGLTPMPRRLPVRHGRVPPPASRMSGISRIWTGGRAAPLTFRPGTHGRHTRGARVVHAWCL